VTLIRSVLPGLSTILVAPTTRSQRRSALSVTATTHSVNRRQTPGRHSRLAIASSGRTPCVVRGRRGTATFVTRPRRSHSRTVTRPTSTVANRLQRQRELLAQAAANDRLIPRRYVSRDRHQQNEEPDEREPERSRQRRRSSLHADTTHGPSLRY